jgi:hypothetical protein
MFNMWSFSEKGASLKEVIKGRGDIQVEDPPFRALDVSAGEGSDALFFFFL